ncbi:hypothetical protein [Fibrella aquatilis]|uniref:Uncharacterized protein n=1 Tax=Fibrella aquatilis TaxID=2817059 RepID=A0A939GA18_9BACT|nr:hypothetical protein [Fibrella aquatilis]MBO0933755.1 hypothetical protein [Fibrella aquatilis]
MNKNTIWAGVGIALGSYLYEVANNLYQKLALGSALVDVNWLRILFLGLFSLIIVSLLNRRKQTN